MESRQFFSETQHTGTHVKAMLLKPRVVCHEIQQKRAMQAFVQHALSTLNSGDVADSTPSDTVSVNSFVPVTPLAGTRYVCVLPLCVVNGSAGEMNMNDEKCNGDSHGKLAFTFPHPVHVHNNNNSIVIFRSTQS